jgi:hypothetical protein
MPGLQKTLFVLYDNLSQIAKFFGAEAQIVGKSSGFQPELARLLVTINMHMWRFIRFVAVEI